MAEFDWYQATVPKPPEAVRARLWDLAPSGVWELGRKAPHGYAGEHRLVDADGVVVKVWAGGMHAYPHVVFSGEAARRGSQFLRAEFPEHAVTRLDPCIDFGGEGAYDRLQEQGLAVARERAIKVGTAGDHLVTMKGRTLYLGSTKSHTQVRIYDKAEELRMKHATDPVRLLQVPQHLARLEVQVRPKTKEAKQTAARLDPVSMMGSTAWTRHLLQLVAGLELAPVAMGQVWRAADDERAYAALLAQYGAMILRRIEEAGSAECFGLQVQHDLNARAAALRKMRG